MARGAPTAIAYDVQLNLSYTDPADETAGGSWDLLVKSTSAFGLGAIAVNMSGITGVTGVDTGNIVNESAYVGGSDVFRFNLLTGGDVEVVAGSGLLDADPSAEVGLPAGATNVADDELFGNSVLTDPWDNSSLIASGTFGGVRPVLTSMGANEFETNTTVFATAAVLGANSVRGDGVASDNLLPGDANRDGTVGAADVSSLSGGFGTVGSPAWNIGNFNSDNEVGAADVSTLSGSFGLFTVPSPVPLVGAIPEPGTAVLFGMACLTILSRSRYMK